VPAWHYDMNIERAGTDMAPKKSEASDLVALLSQEHESVDDLVELVFDLVEQQLRKRDKYVTAIVHPSLKIVQVVGWYATRGQATKDAPKRVTGYDEQSWATVTGLFDPSSINLDPQPKKK